MEIRIFFLSNNQNFQRLLKSCEAESQEVKEGKSTSKTSRTTPEGRRKTIKRK